MASRKEKFAKAVQNAAKQGRGAGGRFSKKNIALALRQNADLTKEKGGALALRPGSKLAEKIKVLLREQQGPRRVITTPPPAQWAEAVGTAGTGSAAETLAATAGMIGNGAGAGAGGLRGLFSQLMTKYPKAGPLAAGIVPGLLASQVFGLLGKAMTGAQEAKLAEAQLAGVTPEGLFYQAALPAQRAEEMALKQALVSRLTGGVLGPVGVPGETIIGG